MERKSRAQSESIAFVVVILCALVLLNLLGVRYFARWDLTARKLFTLSEGTRHILRGGPDGHGGLHDQLTVTVYFTPNQPAPASDDERYLRDQLDEYRSISPHVVVRYVTPDNDARRHEADQAGCTKQALQAVNASEEQATIQEVYRCISFEYLGHREKIEFLPPGVQGLEYEISSIIKNVAAPEGQRERTIGFLSGHGELTPEEGMQYLSQLMEQERSQIHTRSINLNNGTTDVPTDIKGLIIANPIRQISDAELRRLDAYLMHGGSIAVFAGGLTFPSVDPTSANGAPTESHINDWLDGYGIHLNGNVVLDPRSSDGIIRQGRQMGRVRLVTWPVVTAMSGTPAPGDLETQGGLDPSFPAVFRLPEFIAPYPSSIALNDARRHTTGGDLRAFARTSPRSIQRTSDFDLNIVEILRQGQQVFEGAHDHGPYILGVALTGTFASAYAGHPPEGAAPAAPLPTVPQRAEHDARLLVIGSGSLFALDTLRVMAQLSGGQRPPNLSLLFNTFDWLSQDTDLLAVRAKDTSDPELRADVSDRAKQVFKWGSIFLLPLVIGMLGILITSIRRNARRNLVAEYGVKTAAAAS